MGGVLDFAQKARVQVWLYEQKNTRLEGQIIVRNNLAGTR